MCNESLVYLTKVFDNKHAKSCPLKTSVTLDHTNAVQQLSFEKECSCDENCGCGCGCGCGCSCSSECFPDDEDPTFEIENAKVIFHSLEPDDPDCLSASQVTLDGYEIDNLAYENSRYFAEIKDLLTDISDCRYMDKGFADKAYFMINNAGPWKAHITAVVTGRMFGCCSTKNFRLCMTTKDKCPISIDDKSTFAVSGLCLPCVINGISPVISFSFDGIGNLLHPEIEKCGSGNCSFKLTGCLITEPTADIEVTRQTLFRTDDQGLPLPCDDIDKCTDHCGDDAQEDKCEKGEKEKNTCNASKSICCQVFGSNGCGSRY